MKKIFTYCCALLLAGGASGVAAETVLVNEDFESRIFPAEGWNIIDNHTEGIDEETGNPNFDSSYGTWNLYVNESTGALAGYANVQITTTYYEKEKEEILVTPALMIDSDQYMLSFMWYAQKDGAQKGYYTFQVMVTTDDGASWEELWNVMDQEDVESSLVDWPWAAWTKYTSSISLAQYSGREIKIGFRYASAPVDGYNSGRFELDNIKVSTEQMVTTPIVSGTASYRFINRYLDIPSVSEMLSVTNVGNGKLEVTGVSGLEGTDFSTTLEPGASLKNGEELGYYVVYSPTMEGSNSATLKIETNGGTLEVVLTGSKVMLEDGYTVESFEGSEDTPAGWSNSGWTRSAYTAEQGYHSMCNSILQNCYLYSPRLDLSDGPYQIVFDHYESFDDDGGTLVPENYMALEIKVDDAEEWTEVWYTSQALYNTWVRDTVDLSNYQSDNVRLRWMYYAVDWSGGFETVASDIYLDNVVLPPFYGVGNVPAAAQNPEPADGVTDCSYNYITLSWTAVQFAQGYKLLVKTGEEVIADVDLTENMYELTAEKLAPSTTYTWSVIPYNEAGSASNVPLWSFTTMDDQTIATFPYFYGFEGEFYPPLGWQLLGDGTAWRRSDISPYAGDYSGFVYQPANKNGLESILQTPPMAIPADNEYVAEFVWAKQRPISLTVLPEGTEYVYPEGDLDGDTLYFEVSVAGSNQWEQLAYTIEETYWVKESISLQAYVGQEILLRWRYYAEDGSNSEAATVDNIYIAQKEQSGINCIGEKVRVSLYPNPASDFVNVAVNDEAEITVYDLSGKAVMHGNNTRFAVNALPAGVYLVKVVTEKETAMLRMVKQ